ncbi:MAG: hypothetical protein IAF38_08530, partial [Bacteroidia bacterium]|nr:hypothetical protein [Bacteroidia bacterium]
MKKIYLLFFLFIFQKAFCQGLGKFVTDNQGSTPWNVYTDKIKYCADGGAFYVHVITNQTITQTTFTLVKTDSLFNIQWAKEITNLTATAKIADLGEIPAGGFYVYAVDNNNGTASTETET